MKHGLIIMPLGRRAGGSEWMLWHLLSARSPTKSCRWSVVFLETGSFPEDVARLGVPTYTLDAGRIREVDRYAKTVARIRTIAKAHNVDFILSWIQKAHVYGGPAAQLAGLPAMWYQLALPSSQELADRIVGRIPAEVVLAVSECSQIAQLRVTPQRRVEVVYPGVDVETLEGIGRQERSHVRRGLGLPEGAFVMGFVGRLQRWKGVHVIIRALRHLVTRHQNVLLVIVGGRHEFEPAYVDSLLRLVKELGLSYAVRFVDSVSQPALWMRSFDCLIHSSVTEPFGLVLLEAMSVGTPVVSVNLGGPAEIIRHNVNGLLVPPNNPEATAEAIESLIRDDMLASRLLESGRSRASEFSAGAYKARLEDVCLTHC